VSPTVSIAIVNWNGLHYLRDCLISLEAQTFTDFEVIVVDNGSTDGSVEWVTQHVPRVRLIHNTTNVGFAAANNQAIRASAAPYIVTLNNDTRLDPDWLAVLVAAAEAHPDVGMCASKMLFADRPDVINSTGIRLDPVGIAWDRRGGEADIGDEREPIEVFGPCAGAALYRRSMLEQIGLFDEDFFAYLEDVDLAWRARLAGWRCLYVPAARVHHVHSATSVEGSPLKSYLLGRNKVWLIAKDYPILRLLIWLPLILLYDMAAVVFALIARRDVYALKGRLEGWLRLRVALRKRRAAQPLKRSASGRSWHHYLDPLTPPWRVLERYAHLTRTVKRR